MASILTFEEAVLRLQAYWRELGCLVWQPMNTEVGAGTMNPATFLRALGRQPWRVAYVEPSVRPDDSRYGENPNRMQTHTQFQVLLKPDTGCPVEQYLGSLEALGIDPRVNDVRLVEDNWASPALGAWGLGWEIWLNGLEITQFTYFQQAGGMKLEPVSVEITYGLERILMALQHRTHFADIEYADGVRYGELFRRSEYEMSVFYLDVADVSRTRKLFDLHEAEAEHLLDARLALPAYSQVLRMSHLFNILDARGGIGVAERAASFARMRRLTRRCAELWVEKLDDARPEDPRPVEPPPPSAKPSRPSREPATVDLLVEVGVEELPPADLAHALAYLRGRFPDVLGRARLSFAEATVEVSPRRLVLRATDVPTHQGDLERLVRGPAVSSAFDGDGEPTRAAAGFARKHRLEPEQLERETVDGREFVAARVVDRGRPSADVIGEALEEVLASLKFPRAMRWNASGVEFSRPIRWILGLLGERVLPLSFAGLPAGRTTRRLRGDERPVELRDASDYAGMLREVGVVVDRDARRRDIWERATALAAEALGTIDPGYEHALLDEVTDLVEAPKPLLGSFDESYLRLPGEVLATVMVKHQRYFPVAAADGRLLPRFVVVADGQIDPERVREGNEAVIRARYADAEFFWKQDCRRPFADFRQEIGRLMFHERLGSMLDKADRLELMAGRLAQRAGMAGGEYESTVRAAHLSKNDLATSMVIELSSLAGTMGAYYAELAGEPPAVAAAIREHVKPTSTAGEPPASRPGAVVALADRLDSLVGLFAAGVQPASDVDPYGLRRAAYGVVRILGRPDLAIDLREAVDLAAELQPIDVPDAIRADVMDFIWRRLDVSLRDSGLAHDVVRAAIAGDNRSVATKMQTARELSDLVGTPSFARAYQAWHRAANLAKGAPKAPEVEDHLLHEPAEQAAWIAYRDVAADPRVGASVAGFTSAFERLVDPVNRLLEEVLIHGDDERIVRNRLSLLSLVARLPRPVADLALLGPSLTESRAPAGAQRVAPSS
jgi:glycyl-tRNA synthetase